jgi:hypothetical protein
MDTVYLIGTAKTLQVAEFDSNILEYIQTQQQTL